MSGASKDTAPSGFTRSIDSEMEQAAPLPVESAFSGLSLCYVSASGHTRLLTATRYGKRYMLKCLKADFLYTPVYRQALTKEFEIGLQLDHPNICRTIGMEEVEGLGATIVMEFIDGDTLESLIAAHALTAPMARRAARQLAAALDYLHSKQITHRDLKPSNIMVTHTGHNVRLIDFSLADSDNFSVLKLPAGTSGYIAPEQLLPGAKADPQADIWSLGMVMLDMARATGDKNLARAARACTRRRPEARPTCSAEIFAATRGTRLQRVAAIALLCAIAALALHIAATLHRRAALPPTDAAASPADSAGDGNRAMDISQWPEAE